MAREGSETVVVRSAPKRNSTGDLTPGAVKFTVANAIIWPRASDESAERGTRIIDGLMIFLPEDSVTAEVKATDELEARGKKWNVDGAAGDFRKKDGSEIGLLIATIRSGV